MQKHQNTRKPLPMERITMVGKDFVEHAVINERHSEKRYILVCRTKMLALRNNKIKSNISFMSPL
jgi:hypothetical protein